MIATPLQESIVERVRQIDNLLFKLGGNGRNMQERAQSVGLMLDAHDVRQLSRIIAVNRRMVFDNDFRIEGDHRRFIAACEWLIVRLETRLVSRAAVQHWPVVSNESQGNKLLAASAGLRAWSFSFCSPHSSFD